MKSVVLIPNPTKDKGLLLTEEVASRLLSLGASVYVSSEFSGKNLPAGVLYADPSALSPDLYLVIGGDGSVLDAARLAIEKDAPLLGVNHGKLGYLCAVEKDGIDALSRIVSGDVTVEEKTLLSVKNEAGEERLAVNDVVVSHGGYLGISDFGFENSAGERVSFRADALIVSTPIGSTAYSLSAGGPIVSGDVDAMILTPVAPHSFFNRSVVFSAKERLRLYNTGDSDLEVSADGRPFVTLCPGGSCVVTVAARRLKMLSLGNNPMFSTLFRKMRIMEDNR